MIRLDEQTLKDIQRKQERKKIIKSTSCRVWYWGIRLTPIKNFLTLYFKCLDRKGTKRKHLVRIVLDDYPKFLETYKGLKPEDIIKKALILGNCRVHCTCESFLYEGFAYLADVRKYGIVKEPRYPHIKNPELKGSICKHCSAALNRCTLFIRSYALDLEKKNFKSQVRIKTGDKIYII